MNEEQTAQATTLQPGDVVRLKSGGPGMTVTKHWDNDPKLVDLAYMTDEGIVQTYSFPEACLSLINQS